MSSTGRKVYERLTLQDFQTSRIESIAVTDGGGGMKLFVGTADGNLKALTLKSNPITGPGIVEQICNICIDNPIHRHFTVLL